MTSAHFLQYLIWFGAAIAVVLLFGITIFIHEFGHFLAARLCGFRVDAFSIGFGPAIWKKRIGETDYKVSWIPFGGYVALPQLDPAGMQAIQGAEGEASAEPIPQAIWWKRIIVSLAGPVGNIILAFVLALLVRTLPESDAHKLRFDGAVIGSIGTNELTVASGLRIGDKILSVNGNPTQSWYDFLTECHFGAATNTITLQVTNVLDGAVGSVIAPIEKNVRNGMYGVPGIEEASLCAIGSVTNSVPDAKSPAELAGLQPHDVLYSVNGTRIVNTTHAIDLIGTSTSDTLEIEYMRNSLRSHATVHTLPHLADPTRRMIGATLMPASVSIPSWLWYRNPVDQIVGDAKSVGRVLKALVAPKQKGEAKRVGKALGGPIMIISSMWFTVLSGLAGTLAFVRFLNINLAILNLLPLPVLDGGHIVFALWRGIFRREIHPKIMNGLVNAFAFLLIGTFLFISFRDVVNISRLFGGAKTEAVAPGTKTEDTNTVESVETTSTHEIAVEQTHDNAEIGKIADPHVVTNQVFVNDLISTNAIPKSAEQYGSPAVTLP